jgi:peptidoglycan hydrolase-like protein with peptidoglycan-binding domain
MKGTKYNHTGIYLGNGKVFECTTGWGTKKCIISDIDSKGTRSYKGVKNLKWTYHGKLKWIDYSDEPTPLNQTAILQECMNKQWGCGLDVDGHFGPKTREQCRKHQLTFNCKAPIMVKWLQTRLKELGYSLAVDGSFGYDTKKKVIDFQKKKHLNPDAIVGENTYKALTE